MMRVARQLSRNYDGVSPIHRDDLQPLPEEEATSTSHCVIAIMPCYTKHMRDIEM